MFQQLNEEDGITLILVTHDANVAQHAKRLIHIRDGLIIDGNLATDTQPADSRADLMLPAAKVGNGR